MAIRDKEAACEVSQAGGQIPTENPQEPMIPVGWGRVAEVIRTMYEARFKAPGLRCEVHHRSEIGNIAIDRETVHTDGNPPVDILAMYEVVENKIQRIFFVRESVNRPAGAKSSLN